MGKHRAEDREPGFSAGTRQDRDHGGTEGWQLGGRQDEDRAQFNQALADQHAREYQARHANTEC